MNSGSILKLTVRAPALPLPQATGTSPHVTTDGIDFEKYVAGVERSLIESALQQSGGVPDPRR